MDLIILDVGCATGESGDYLLKAGIAKYVIGIEPDNKMASLAKKKLSDVFKGTVENYLEKTKDFERFDYIILGDILEHLVNPWDIVAKIKTCLKPDGKIIISIPNIRRFETFYEVFIKGKWPYNDNGIHDRTHLRFFTRSNIVELFEDAGLQIDNIHSKRVFLESNHNFSFWIRLFLKFAKRQKFFQEWMIYQYIVVASIK
ncbi:MAG: class I SAM-dependent methyltransferase [Bacteroidales bacterium]|nr:class I SAM-dependent methyltransferase [Bacteroidales bacterium]